MAENSKPLSKYFHEFHTLLLWEEQHDRNQSRENCKCLANLEDTALSPLL